MASTEILTVAEAAHELGLDPAEVYRLIFACDMATEPAENGRLLVSRAALEDFRRRSGDPSHTTA
jgi:hypothetical protein